jgi:hypothetical protein
MVHAVKREMGQEIRYRRLVLLTGESGVSHDTRQIGREEPLEHLLVPGLHLYQIRCWQTPPDVPVGRLPRNPLKPDALAEQDMAHSPEEELVAGPGICQKPDPRSIGPIVVGDLLFQERHMQECRS